MKPECVRIIQFFNILFRTDDPNYLESIFQDPDIDAAFL